MATTFFLDARCMGQEQLHNYLMEHLPLPNYYGGNLDALHDCLTELSDTQLIISHTKEAAPFFARVERVLFDSAKENPALSVVFYEGNFPKEIG